MSNNTIPRMTTPQGSLSYPRLDKPDTKFKELGEYKADLIVPLKEAKPLIDKLAPIYEQHVGKKLPKKPYKGNKESFYFLEQDKKTEEETGNVVFKLRVANRLNKQDELWDRKPKVFNAFGQPLDTRVGGGSTAKVAFDTYLWKTPAGAPGMSLQPVAVLVSNLVEGSGGDADSFFDADDLESPIEALGGGEQEPDEADFDL